jgi:hypothetical protein
MPAIVGLPIPERRLAATIHDGQPSGPADRGTQRLISVAGIAHDQERLGVDALADKNTGCGTDEDAGIPELDGFLETGFRSLMAHDGREMIRWMSSHLNRRSFGKVLVTAYIARDQGRERQYQGLLCNSAWARS